MVTQKFMLKPYQNKTGTKTTDVLTLGLSKGTTQIKQNTERSHTVHKHNEI
jgi:hypothetical protein